MSHDIDTKRSEILAENPGLQDALITREAKHTLSSFGPKWRKPVENEVLSSAALFYRKFFCSNSLAAYNPVHVLLAALALACKTEESHHITLRDLCSGDLQCFEESIELELDLLRALDFKIEVSQPWPIILFFSSKLAERGKPDGAQKLFDVACEALSAWQWTDAIVVYPFPLLAIAAVAEAAQVCGFSESFTDIVSNDFGSHLVEFFTSLPGRVKAIINRHPRPSHDAIDALSKRCIDARASDKPSKKRRKIPD